MMKIATFLLLASLPAMGWQNEVNVPKNGTLKPISPTKLSYDLSWNGKLKAGNMDILFGKKDPKYPKHFITQAYGGSTGWAHALFPFQFNYISFLNPKTRRPLMFVGSEKERDKLTKQEYRFTSSGVTGLETKTRDGKVRTSKDKFPYPNSLDLFSGLLQIRSMTLKNGEKVIMPFHPVASPYLARVKVLGRETHRGRKCIKLDISMEKIDEKMQLKEYKKLKSATVWLSDDAWRIPIEVRAKVYVGDVRILLTKQEAF
ncbi:DUF3108 domain-containing protein [Akkermansiaceae bacterium]|nr:DUF3108 domain-containing protein [Akkermansiaceae bacterium]MDA8875952.1 DUF3108 domain-containing protein [Akkermansiaceae bacterium]MDB4692672.1 DUF3108 domain-containing protein [Akkermansiaceae bacterium]